MTQVNTEDKVSALHTNTDKATDRIRKLLAIANDDRANEGERETAMSMATKLMAKHNMDMVNFADPAIPKESRKHYESEHHPCPWRRVVAQAIAQLFFCNFFSSPMQGKQKRIFTFVGLESNATVAKEMTDWLIKSVAREATIKQKEHRGDHSFATSFQNAASARIQQRCFELRQSAEQEHSKKSSSTALVLVDVYKQEFEANLKHIADEMGITLKHKKLKGQITNAEGAHAGRVFGDKVPLNTQLPSKAAAPKAAIK